MRKQILLSITALAMIVSVAAQQTSPYVQPGTLIINNSGFKATSIRTTPITRPTPMHTLTGSENLRFPAQFVVAKADPGGPKSWAEANGWTNAANTAVSGGVVSLIPAGCNAYFELNAPLGQWRLPTQREMILIAMVKLELLNQGQGFSALTGTYWCATQNGATTAWAYTFSLSVMYPRVKTIAYQIRCVRDL